MKKFVAAILTCVTLCTPFRASALSTIDPIEQPVPGTNVLEIDESGEGGDSSITHEECDVIPGPINQTTAGLNYGSWEKRWDGWYFLFNGKPIRNGEFKIDKKMYRFNNYGQMITGWHFNQDHTYSYYRTCGAKVINDWIHKDDKWYYFDKTGLLNSYLILWKNHVYYSNEKGELVYGWIHNPAELKAKTIYADASGKLCVGWKYLTGLDGTKNWYYFYPDEDGSPNPCYGMAVNTWVDDGTGTKYWVDQNGVWNH